MSSKISPVVEASPRQHTELEVRQQLARDIVLKMDRIARMTRLSQMPDAKFFAEVLAQTGLAKEKMTVEAGQATLDLLRTENFAMRYFPIDVGGILYDFCIWIENPSSSDQPMRVFYDCPMNLNRIR